MDPLSIIASAISIIEGIYVAYGAVEEIAGLPAAIDAVRSKVPIAEQTLRAARTRLRRDPEPSDEEMAAIVAIIKPCEEKTSQLKSIFEKLGDKAKKDASWEKVRRAYLSVLAGLKGNRVESLMQDIMKGMETLANYQVFQTAMKDDLVEIEKAIKELSAVLPSMDESDIVASNAMNATQNIHDNGRGWLTTVEGEGHTVNAGEYVAAGTGHHIYFGKEPPAPPQPVRQ
jgi:hypothetical protein